MPKVTLTELNEARDELFRARAAFDQAEPEFVDTATLQVTSAQEKFNTLIRLAKQQTLAELFPPEQPVPNKPKKLFLRCLKFFAPKMGT